MWWIYNDIVEIEVSCQKGPNRHAYTWQIGPFWQDTLEMAALIRWDIQG